MKHACKTLGAGLQWSAGPCALALTLWISTPLILGCGDPSRSPREPADQIVLIVIDTLRADRLGLYGGPGDTAPFLSELATRSLVFDAAWAPSSWTGPSMASIFTSMYPNQHGVVLGLRGVRQAGELRTIDVHRIPDSLETIPVFMKSQGYTTFGVSANINVGPIMGFDRGFDHFELIHHPGEEPRGRVARNVTTLDILPTLRRLAGAGAHAQDIGRSLLEPHPAAAEEREIFSMRTDATPEVRAHKRALIRGDYKLILTEPEGAVELYNLRSDAGEQHDLAGEQAERVHDMRQRLAAQAQSAQTALSASGVERPAVMPYQPSAEEAEQLEALGYVDDER